MSACCLAQKLCNPEIAPAVLWGVTLMSSRRFTKEIHFHSTTVAVLIIPTSKSGPPECISRSKLLGTSTTDQTYAYALHLQQCNGTVPAYYPVIGATSSCRANNNFPYDRRAAASAYLHQKRLRVTPSVKLCVGPKKCFVAGH